MVRGPILHAELSGAMREIEHVDTYHWKKFG